MTLISVYFPCDDQHQKRFCLLFDSMLNAINLNTQIVIGSDINAQIGVRTCTEHKQVCGPHRIPRSNTWGESFSKSLLPITYELKSPSSTIAWRSMSPTPVFPWTIIQLVSQACMMYLHAHYHYINKYMTAKQCSTVLPVITRQWDSNLPFHPSNLRPKPYPEAPLTGQKSCRMITLKWFTMNTSYC